MLLGKGERKDASRFFSFAIKLIVALSFAAGVMGLLFAHQFVSLIAPGASEETARMAAEYLIVYAMFAPLVPVYFATDNFLRDCGKQRFGMVTNLYLLRYGGTPAVAAFSIVMYVNSIVGMLAFGVCDALQPAISYCRGAGMAGRVRAIFRRVLAANLPITDFRKPESTRRRRAGCPPREFSLDPAILPLNGLFIGFVLTNGTFRL